MVNRCGLAYQCTNVTQDTPQRGAQSTGVFILSVDAAMSRYQTSQLLRIRTTRRILSIYNLWLHASAMAIQANAKDRRNVQPRPHKQHIVDFNLLVPHTQHGVYISPRETHNFPFVSHRYTPTHHILAHDRVHSVIEGTRMIAAQQAGPLLAALQHMYDTKRKRSPYQDDLFIIRHRASFPLKAV